MVERLVPVSTGVDTVMATAYVRQGQSALLALASWSNKSETVRLTIDWDLLGLDPAVSEFTAPPLPSFNRNHETVTFLAPHQRSSSLLMRVGWSCFGRR